MSKRVRVSQAEPTTGTRVRIEFTNGEVREMDLAPFLHGAIFEAIRANPAAFRNFHVDEELGTVVWPNGADIDPDVLYEGLTPAWRESPEAA
jgi:hypothetical protein